MNFFEALELPEKLSIDPKLLESRFYSFSRQWHPDRFARASAEEQQNALDRSALLNDAFRTLRNPVSRAEYFLTLRAIAIGDTKKVPPELLEEVFELNMALEEVKMGDTDSVPQLRDADTRFRRMLEGADVDLQRDFRAWDETGDPNLLDQLRERLNYRKYISNLVRDTGQALEKYNIDHHVSD